MTDREKVRAARKYLIDALLKSKHLSEIADAVGVERWVSVSEGRMEERVGFLPALADALLAPAASGTEPDAWGLRDKTTRKVVVARAGRDAVYDALRNMGGADGHLDTLPVPLYLTAPAAPTPEQVERVYGAVRRYNGVNALDPWDELTGKEREYVTEHVRAALGVEP